MRYWDRYTFTIPARAEYLRFTPSDGYSTSEAVLWTRSNPEATIRGKNKYNREFEIEKLTQDDNGLYTFQTKSHWSTGKTRIFVDSECVFLCISFIINVVEPRASGWLSRLVATDDWTRQTFCLCVLKRASPFHVKNDNYVFSVPLFRLRRKLQPRGRRKSRVYLSSATRGVLGDLHQLVWRAAGDCEERARLGQPL